MPEQTEAMYSRKATKVESSMGALGTVAATTSRHAAITTSGPIDLVAVSAVMWSWIFCSVLMALAATVRASGSDISFSRRCISGSSSGRKGLASRGSSISFDMLSTITATLRLISVFFSWQPRRRMGIVTESAGESTDCTKTVAESLCTVSATSSGFWMALMRAGTNGLMSRLSTELQADCMALTAAFFTSALVSHTPAATTGIASCKIREKALGCFSASLAMRFSE
mmetsp:Transcript_10167/g.29172  ORF Transcript_10167/g.29172 Transcript_10167/m.29172 type:complete len:227 (-) Transcript_10167:625-1305(-)